MPALEMIRHRFYDNAGNLNAGGWVYTYTAGTTTLKNSYTDYTGSTPNTNPIQLDSKGECNMWLDGLTKVNVLDVNLVQITGYPVDYIGSDNAGSITEPFSASTINGVAPFHLNPIRNGAFQIAQRGTSFAAPVNGAYDMDGWLNGNSSAAVFTVAQVAGSVTGRMARQVTITTADAAVAAGDYMFDITSIEGYDIVKYVGQTFTIAFRMRVPVTGIHCVALLNSASDRTYVKEINFPTANAWRDCTMIVTGGLPTSGTWNYASGKGLELRFAHLCGTAFQTTPDAWNTGNFIATANQVNDCATIGNVWAIEEVRMGLGTVAPPMETDYHAELARSQRYYEIVTTAALITAAGANNYYGGRVGFLVTKRAAPTITLISAGNVINTSSINKGSSTGDSFRIYAASTAAGTAEFYDRTYSCEAEL